MDDSDIESVDDSHSTTDKTVDNSETVDNTKESHTDWYPVSFLQRLHDFRSEGHLVDVTLCAEGKEIPCHRLVLSACSDYFYTMFNGAHCESKKDKIEIGGVSAEALQQLVDYAYTSKITITFDNVQPLFEAANMLQVKGVEDRCEKFLTNNLSPETCLVTWVLADKVSSEPLLERAKIYTLKHFEDVCVMEEFLELPVDFLKTCISDDGLHAKKEKRVLEVVMLWVRHLKERQTHLKELLECVRFPHVDREYLNGILETDKLLAGVSAINELTQDQSRHARPRHIQGEILVFGGLTRSVKPKPGDDYDSNDDMYKLTLNCDCVDISPLPPIIWRASAACVVNGDVFITGGANARCHAWRYKPSVDSWTNLGPLVNKERLVNSMVALQGQVYVVGGVGTPKWTPVYDVEVYSEMTDSWKLVAPLLNEGVKDFGIASFCDKIFVFGGRTGKCTLLDHSHNTDAVQCYDPTQNVWTYAAPLPNPMQDIAACSVSSKIYLVGGMLAHVLCYDPQQDCYEKMTDRLNLWSECSATTCGSDIYIIGGCGHDDQFPHATVQRYNVTSDTMVLLKDFPITIFNHISVIVPKA
ncbi:kelch-like protein 24 isoform X2 [Branchiostoma floridae]|nr:kelch-like protein 24 isoform X2 [Branchiostoma floridae]XP_035699313.1 kelch-like protein 24 isoform X2 [Branchiostoma floridae]